MEHGPEVFANFTPDMSYITGQRIMDCALIRHADISDEGITFKQKIGMRMLVAMTPDLQEVITQAQAIHRSARMPRVPGWTSRGAENPSETRKSTQKNQ